MQDLLGKEWQERRRATQKHREQVEGDRAEQFLLAADEGDAFHHALEKGASGERTRARPFDVDREDNGGHDSEQHKAQREGEARAQHQCCAAKCWSGDDRDLHD